MATDVPNKRSHIACLPAFYWQMDRRKMAEDGTKASKINLLWHQWLPQANAHLLCM